MAARTPDQILDSILNGKGRGATVRRKLVANKERNWLLALTLNSFAKLAANAQLSDLEQAIVTAYTKNGFSEQELRQHGLTYQRIPAQLRSEFFPREFAALTPDKSYSVKDLKQDAPGIVSSVLNQANVTNIDVEAVHSGAAHLRDFSIAPKSVRREHGGSMLVALAPNVSSATSRYTIKAASFRCVDRQTDSIFGPSNEPYWIFGSLGGGTPVTTRSQVFGDVDSGETRNFSSSEGCIWGQNCAAQALPDGEIASLIQLWEHDEGNPEKVKTGVKAAFAAAAVILAASGVAAWVAAVVAGVGAVLQWLLGLLDDDHIADQTITFTRQVVEDRLKKAGQSFTQNHTFSDGDGDYRLTIKVARAT